MKSPLSISLKFVLAALSGLCLVAIFSVAIVQYTGTISSDAALATLDGKLHLISSELILTTAQLSEKQNPTTQTELLKNMMLQIEQFESILNSIQLREWENTSWFPSNPAVSKSIASAEDEWKNELKPFLLAIRQMPPEEVKVRLATFYEYNRKVHKSLDATVLALEQESHRKID